MYLVPVYAALVSLVACHVWLRQPRARWAVVLALSGMIAVQTGGVVYRMRIDKHRAYDDAVAYLTKQVAPGAVVMGSQELGFGIGFGDGFVDDPYLGTKSGRVPDYIVMEEIYRLRMATLRERSPNDYALVQSRLAAYDVVYGQGLYEILARKPTPRQ